MRPTSQFSLAQLVSLIMVVALGFGLHRILDDTLLFSFSCVLGVIAAVIVYVACWKPKSRDDEFAAIQFIDRKLTHVLCLCVLGIATVTVINLMTTTWIH